MWIKIKKDVFEKSDFKTLNFIIQLLTWTPSDSVDRYYVFVDSDVELTENYKKLQKLDKELLQARFLDFNNNSKKIKYYISFKNKNLNEFNIEEAIRFFNQPVSIILENSLNDGYFLKAIFRYFDKKIEGDGKRKLIEFMKNDWIQFVNAGGCTNIKNYIKGKLKTYEHLPVLSENQRQKYLRCFVLIDSDKKYPTQSIDSGKEKLKKWLEDNGIGLHILKKRAMENYMPDEVIEKISSDNSFKSWTKVYSLLSKDQKNFLDYKSGFSKKDYKGKATTERNELHMEIKKLYLNLDETKYRILDQGLNLPYFKDNFPALFEDASTAYLIHKNSLLNREGGTETENEFLEILQKINNFI